ncbi:MAG: MoaD/ThiS family protein [Rhodospirillales bacterium]|nr:MoaD/ThiS family protein [Rhodospirillales bacterium]
MDLKVSFMGVIAGLTGEKERTFSFEEPPTLRGLLDTLEARYGETFAKRIYRSATQPRLLQLCLRIFVDGNLVDHQALDEPLPPPPADRPNGEILVYLLPASTGG